jgi:hypothetical protein
MARVLICAALAVTLSACSFVPDYGRASPSPTTPVAVGPSATIAVRPVTYTVTPFEIRPGPSSTTKTAIFFWNGNTFALDWWMAVRLKDKDGVVLRDERIGNADAPADRSDPRFQNWYFPIPPGESWTIVRFETSFTKGDIQDFEVVRSSSAVAEVRTVRVSAHSCVDDSGTGIECQIVVEAAGDVPAFTRLHLVVAIHGKDGPPQLLRGLQWRPELIAATSPWLKLGGGQKLSLEFHDNYPTPAVAWDYEVFARAYQFPRSN